MRKILNLKVLLALVIISAITLYSPLSYFLNQKSYAGYATLSSVQISDSRASHTSTNYNYGFTVTTTTSIKQINIKFCTEQGAFTDTCTPPAGFSASSATRASDNIAGTGRTDTPGANTFQTVITTPAAQSTTAVTFNLSTITNPSTTNTTYYTRVITYSDTGTTEIDHTEMAFAILTTTSMAVSASIDPSLSFTIAGVSSGGTVNTATTNVTTTPSTIPFGSLSIARIAANDITVNTNAGNGYTVAVAEVTSPPLVSGADNIDEFTGTNATPTPWSAPAGSTPSVNTGFFGYTTEDSTLSGVSPARFTTSAPNWAGPTTSLSEVAYNNTYTAGNQTTRIGWEAQANGNQPPGTYTGTVVLVATPTY
jgi:hypothetical protein